MWQAASVEGKIEGISSAEYTGTILWKSGDDLAGMDLEAVGFRLVPEDGAPDEIYFGLDNNLPPAVTLGDVGGNRTRDVAVSYLLVDSDGDSLRLRSEYSRDGGANWSAAHVTGDTVGIGLDRYSDQIVWHSLEDLGYGSHPEVRFRITPSDNDSGAPGASGAFSVQNFPADYDGDLAVDFEDLTTFLVAWNGNDLARELGPATGAPPELIPQPDGKLDFEDLAVFILMWNWSAGTYPKAARWAGAGDPERGIRIAPRIQEIQEERVLVEFDVEEAGDLLAVEVVLRYDPSSLKYLRLIEGDLFSRVPQGTLFLSKEDEAKGALLIHTGRLGGGAVDRGSVARVWFERRSEGPVEIAVDYDLRGAGGERLRIGGETLEVMGIPTACALLQNHPNPFNAQTVLRYSLPAPGWVRLAIYDLLGREVRRLSDGRQDAGHHSAFWDGRDESGRKVGSGLYLYRLVVEGQGRDVVRTRKMLLLR